MSRLDGGPAFPCELRLPGATPSYYLGISLRDYFAAAALQAHIASKDHDSEAVAVSCYRYADAMLLEREK